VALTILEGSTFCICDERGDVEGETAGFFADDTRHLSLFRLTVNGQRPLLLSSGKVEYFSAAFYLRNPLAGELPQDAISIVRTRFVGDGMQDRFSVRNESMQPLSFELALDLGSDFADIFAVKSHDFSLGDPLHARPLPPLIEGHWLDGRYVLEDTEVDGDRPPRTQVVFSLPGRIDGSHVVYEIALGPREH